MLAKRVLPQCLKMFTLYWVADWGPNNLGSVGLKLAREPLMSVLS